jgi:hypothetical protein
MANPGVSGLLVPHVLKGMELHGRGRRREAFRREVWVKPWRRAEPQERIVARSQAARRGCPGNTSGSSLAELIPRSEPTTKRGRRTDMALLGQPIILWRGSNSMREERSWATTTG